MTLHSIDTRWLDGMAFENFVDGFSFVVDAAEEFGGGNRGPRPKLLLLNALSGCTGMDVVSMLGKMKQNLTWFNIHVEGNLGDEHPKTYQALRVIYQFKKADGLDNEKVQKAVTMSQDKYCGVSAMLGKVCDLTWSIEYLD